MQKDTITLILKGDIPLAEFADAIKYFQVLIEALSDEVAGSVDIDWRISRLDTGSAIASITGFTPEITYVERVVQAYTVVGRSLANREPVPYSEEVVTPALEMTRIINGHITDIQFVVNEDSFTISESLADNISLISAKEEVGIRYMFGAITGTVDTISRRKGIGFMLYDDIFDRAVRCNVPIEQQEMLRGIWGKRVKVIGFIQRDPETGRASSIKNIQKIDILSQKKDGYRQARGVLPWHPNDEPAEKIIRWLRDAS